MLIKCVIIYSIDIVYNYSGLVLRFANIVTYFDYVPHPNCSLDSAELVAGSTKS
jgi:hypothetical protein